ncbi:hypothetical protein C5167_037230 [Papaver somniferum]|uniref:Uncharacterized protein n=1 Tax=Papaver somniferum TaxID=3469 RepID=A0A4Y7IA56_PAPSO|nr:hypothetical protein C5167_037230 [Papaver somniferum]
MQLLNLEVLWIVFRIQWLECHGRMARHHPSQDLLDALYTKNITCKLSAPKNLRADILHSSCDCKLNLTLHLWFVFLRGNIIHSFLRADILHSSCDCKLNLTLHLWFVFLRADIIHSFLRVDILHSLSMRFTMMAVGFDLGNIAPVDSVTGIGYTEWLLSKECYLIFYQIGCFEVFQLQEGLH